jgi:hypothetical protein
VRAGVRFFALAVLLIALGNVLFVELYGSLAVFPVVGSWHTVHFMFSYQDLGFVKRGLVGTLLDIDNDASSPAAVVLFASATALAFAALVTVAALRAPCDTARTFILLSPAVFLQAGYDFGRLDTVNHVLMLLIFLSGSRWAVLFAPLTILVHEAALFSVLPLVVSVHVLRFGIRWELVLCCAVSLMVLAVTLLFGRYEGSIPLAEIYPNQDPTAFEVLTYGIQDNIALTLEEFTHVDEVFWAMFAAILFHYACILLHIGLAYGRTRLFFAVGASLPPLCLMIIGTDWTRWVALCTVNVLLFHLFTRDSASTGAARERRLLETNRTLVLAVAVISALSGPMGVTTPPVLTQFVWRLVDDA